MRVLILGATGMVGQGVLRECLLASDVTQVIALGRSATGQRHEKLTEIVHADLTHLAPVESQLMGLDACFFCLGVSAAGMTEAQYARITFDLTVAVATWLVRVNRAMTLVYVSGRSTDSSEGGRVMWARVKGKTENALLAMPFKAAYMFRPGFIIPMHGMKSKTPLYRLVYAIATPLYPLLRHASPRWVTTTEQVGRAMLTVARGGWPTRVLESEDIVAAGTR